jgi:hypothetical protein
VVGVDLDEPRIREAQRRATDRGLGDRASFLAADGVAAGPSPVQALVAIGASQVWGRDVAEEQPLDYGAALAGMRSRLVRGGRLVYGEAIWSRSPGPEATAPLSGREDEFLRLPDLVDLAVAHGFAVAGVQEATLDEWDEFESGFTAGYATWLATHEPDHPGAAEARDRAGRQRTGYLRGYRGVLGMAYLQLMAV